MFANPGSYSGFENLIGLYAYSLQVYADFSGYTDMAIGVPVHGIPPARQLPVAL